MKPLTVKRDPFGDWKGVPLGLLLTMFSGSLGAFDEVPVGARPAGMGEAFVSVADDVHSLYYNPAGLAGLYRPEVSAYYARLFPELSDQSDTALTFLGGASPMPMDGRWGGMALGYTEFHAASLFKEKTISLGYGRFFLSDRLALGMGLKQLTRTFGSTADTNNAFSGLNPNNRTGSSDPLFRGGNSKNAWGADVGGLFALTEKLRLGLSCSNVNRPDIGLQQKEVVPSVTRLGMTYDKSYVRLSAEVSRRKLLEDAPDHRVHLGGERQWSLKRFGSVTARGGAVLGGRDVRRINVGAGYEVNGLVLDYVFTLALGAAQDTGNTHNMSLSFKFGRGAKEDDLEAELKEEREASERAIEALKAAEEEMATLKGERDKMLGHYATELERVKGELESLKTSAGSRVPVVVIDQHLSAEERAQLARERAESEYNLAYQAAMRAYTKLVDRGANLTERMAMLKSTLEKYGSKGVKVGMAARELENLKAEFAQVSTDFRITMDFYRKTVARGSDPLERLSLLDRILKKYVHSGLDLKEVREEIAKLKQSMGRKPR